MILSGFRGFATKLEQTTPRERAGLAMLAAIGAITAVVYAADWASMSADTAATASQAAADMSALQANLQDEHYRQQLSAGAGRVWRWSRTADAFAGEEITTELEALCLQAGFADPRVSLVEAEPSRSRVGDIEASVSATFDWAHFLALLEAFESSELSFSVRSVDVSEADGVQLLTLLVAVPSVSPDGAP